MSSWCGDDTERCGLSCKAWKWSCCCQCILTGHYSYDPFQDLSHKSFLSLLPFFCSFGNSVKYILPSFTLLWRWTYTLLSALMHCFFYCPVYQKSLHLMILFVTVLWSSNSSAAGLLYCIWIKRNASNMHIPSYCVKFMWISLNMNHILHLVGSIPKLEGPTWISIKRKEFIAKTSLEIVILTLLIYTI